MKANVTSFSLRKTLAFSILPLLLVLVLAELFLRCVYFQQRSDTSLAITKAFHVIAHRVVLARSGVYVSDYEKTYKGAQQRLFSQEGEELLQEFERTYEAHFRNLVTAVHNAESKFVLLYVPSMPPNNPSVKSETIGRNFFRHLSERYRVDLLDMTETLRQYHWEDVTLLPHDSHLSRFGNKLVAKRLNEFLQQHDHHRSSRLSSRVPPAYGDLKPTVDYLEHSVPNLPYRVTTNAQGFRNAADLSEDKVRQRVLVLGDSFTFGPYLHNQDAYPALLQQVNPKLEVINAGVSGYTITDETSLFVEQAQFIDPDVTVLQVLDNDLSDLFHFMRNEFDRKKNTHTPSPLEETFLAEVVSRNTRPENR